MKKRMKLVIVLAVVATMMVGCKKSSVAEDAVKQGKLAMASLEYEKAVNSFSLAVAEGNKEDEISQLITSLNTYLEAVQSCEKNDYDKVLELLDGLMVTEPVSFQKDIESLREITIEQKQQKEEERLLAEQEALEQEQREKEEAEKLAEEEAEKLAAEEEAKEKEQQQKEEQEKIEQIISKIYQVTGDNRNDTEYMLEEKGYMTNDMVAKYYCFSVSYHGDMADNNIIVDKETLELFTYDPYSGKQSLEKISEIPTYQVTSEEDAEKLAYEVMKKDGYDYVIPSAFYHEEYGLYVVEGMGESKPDCMYTVDPVTGKVENVH